MASTAGTPRTGSCSATRAVDQLVRRERRRRAVRRRPRRHDLPHRPRLTRGHRPGGTGGWTRAPRIRRWTATRRRAGRSPASRRPGVVPAREDWPSPDPEVIEAADGAAETRRSDGGSASAWSPPGAVGDRYVLPVRFQQLALARRGLGGRGGAPNRAASVAAPTAGSRGSASPEREGGDVGGRGRPGRDPPRPVAGGDEQPVDARDRADQRPPVERERPRARPQAARRARPRSPARSGRPASRSRASKSRGSGWTGRNVDPERGPAAGASRG